jgi:hypothetical protein
LVDGGINLPTATQRYKILFDGLSSLAHSSCTQEYVGIEYSIP